METSISIPDTSVLFDTTPLQRGVLQSNYLHMHEPYQRNHGVFNIPRTCEQGAQKTVHVFHSPLFQLHPLLGRKEVETWLVRLGVEQMNSNQPTLENMS